MNQIENKLKTALAEAFKNAFEVEVAVEEITIEIPKDKSHGDYATNIAMKSAKKVGKNPRMIAQGIVDALDTKSASVKKMEIAGPGFINFFMESESLANVIGTVLAQEDNYGCSDAGKGLKVNIEYVSANPTGDLHPGHARGAAMGDSISRIMMMAGYDVTREYYVNDAGNQIRNMAISLQTRYLQACGKDVEMPEDGYHGPDLIEIAEAIKSEFGDKYAEVDTD